MPKRIEKRHEKVVETVFSDPSFFEQMFRDHYRSLTYFSLTYVKELETAREIVQEVFVNIWEARNYIVIQTAVRPYLYRCVRNASINHLNTKKTKLGLLDDYPHLVHEEDLFANIVAAEIREALYREVEKLPTQCRRIFILSRFDGLKHAEIASKLDLSVKSVENQIGIALKKLSKIKRLLISLLFMIPFCCF
jgi:RNA polymerase sigma-70 factor, ECF subfamily